MFVLLLLTFPLTACESEEDKAFNEAYKAHRGAAYQVAFAEGEEEGRQRGTIDGAAAAQHDAASGTAWQLYWPFGVTALIAGLTVGLAAQYSVLLLCRQSGRLPQFSTVALVPAMKSSFAYTLFERRRKAMAEIDEQLKVVAARKDLQAAQIKALTNAIELKIKALSSIDELSQARLMELAEEELDRIIRTSAASANNSDRGQALARSNLRITVACPYCEQLIRFGAKSAGAEVSCPNKECRQPIRLPPVFSTDGMPRIFDVKD